MIKKVFFLLLLLFCNCFLFAQDKNSWIATEMRSNGKIYVVVAVLLTIFLGIILYLIRLDRKMSRIEKETKSINH